MAQLRNQNRLMSIKIYRIQKTFRKSFEMFFLHIKKFAEKYGNIMMFLP
ncbi:hypothetical protein HMPREF9083_0651 [Dialister micraerophilus DSM 19965]|uniref:Uncharacterized protein n=1 Tax=Dialister micraerophilus DSM 19965 TaxID=888062 RepID=F2BWT3_9FIRM|nr:hypothetical protein HMPREF9083_0651 [Dialister micraerophilus DSM 19965]